eukprot:Nk52_evm1s476 gene=Nk52_evmTU1s476
MNTLSIKQTGLCLINTSTGVLRSKINTPAPLIKTAAASQARELFSTTKNTHNQQFTAHSSPSNSHITLNHNNNSFGVITLLGDSHPPFHQHQHKSPPQLAFNRFYNTTLTLNQKAPRTFSFGSGGGGSNTNNRSSNNTKNRKTNSSSSSIRAAPQGDEDLYPMMKLHKNLSLNSNNTNANNNATMGGGGMVDLIPIIHAKTTFNNSILTLTSAEGKVLTITSCGANGFKGAKRSTPFAAQTTGHNLAKRAVDDFGIKRVRVKISGIGPARTAVIKGIQTGGLLVMSISDVTPLPHNGCRPRKARR